jgi:hypothetical protein
MQKWETEEWKIGTNKKQNDRSESKYISYYVKCKWSKQVNKQVEVDRLNFKKLPEYFLEGIHVRHNDIDILKGREWENIATQIQI